MIGIDNGNDKLRNKTRSQVNPETLLDLILHCNCSYRDNLKKQMAAV